MPSLEACQTDVDAKERGMTYWLDRLKLMCELSTIINRGALGGMGTTPMTGDDYAAIKEEIVMYLRVQEEKFLREA